MDRLDLQFFRKYCLTQNGIAKRLGMSPSGFTGMLLRGLTHDQAVELTAVLNALGRELAAVTIKASKENRTVAKTMQKELQRLRNENFRLKAELRSSNMWKDNQVAMLHARIGELEGECDSLRDVILTTTEKRQ